MSAEGGPGLRRFRYFVAIVDAGSVTRAASLLHVAQPALSQQMQALEAELGVKVLERLPTGVVPTEAGRMLYERSQILLKMVDSLRVDLANLDRQLSGRVAIGLPTSTSILLGVPIVEAVREEFPDIRLHLLTGVSGRLEERLRGGELDMAILFEPKARQHPFEWLFEEALYLMTPPDMVVPDPYPASALGELQMTLPSTSLGLRSVLDGVFARHGIVPNIVVELDGSVPTISALVSRGICCTITPWVPMAAEVMRGELRGVRITPEIWRPVALCRPHAEPLPRAAEAVFEVLRRVTLEQVAKIAHTGALRLLA